ncbi:MAG: T9SS type A sorting domain-containing protein, partial [Salinivenus sp.]
FGQSVAGGDLDGDGARELAVGAGGPDNGAGALWILEFDASRTVTNANRIDGGSAGITLDANDNFGFSVAALGALDGGGNGDLAVGAFRDDDGGTNRGALWILSLNDDETVAAAQKISDTAGSFGGALDDEDRFGATAAGIGDLDGDGVPDLATGAYLDDDGGSDRGAVWILYLNADGTVKDFRKVSDTEGGFGGTLADGDQFGITAAGLGDLDGDGTPDLLAGAFMDPEAGSSGGPGAVWVLFGEQGLLPVELAAFDGVQAGRAARLRWTTASEQSNAGFRVQHLGPATGSWTQVGFVESAAPGGSTAQSNTYRFTTGTLAAGVHHFRLEQVDLDGSTHLHGPLRVEVTLQRPLRISGPYPNPVRDRATISFAVNEAAETTITLYNVLGQTVSTLYRGTPAAGAAKTAYLDASTLPNGVYVVRLRAGERTESRRLTVLR